MNNIITEIRKYYPDTESFLLFSNNKITIEEYFKGNPKTLRPTASMFKSMILATSVGILLKKKIITSIEMNLEDIFQEEIKDFRTQIIGKITIKQILTHSTGLNWPEPADFEDYDWTNISMMKNFRLSDTPGVIFKYKPDSQIIIWIIEKLTNQTFMDFVRIEIFEKMDIHDYKFIFDGPQLYISSRDILKMGLLYLNEGVYNNFQIIEKEFIDEACSFKIPGGFPGNDNYGYLWWVTELNGTSTFYAGGFGGQHLYLIPDLEMIFIITCDLGRARPEYKSIIRKYFEIEKNTIGEELMKNSPLKLDHDKKIAVLEKIKEYVSEEMDQDIGDLKAEFLLDFIQENLGKEYYNKGVLDTKKFIFQKMEDLEIDTDQILIFE